MALGRATNAEERGKSEGGRNSSTAVMSLRIASAIIPTSDEAGYPNFLRKLRSHWRGRSCISSERERYGGAGCCEEGRLRRLSTLAYSCVTGILATVWTALLSCRTEMVL